MDDKLLAIKASVSAFCMAVGAFLGWRGAMLLVWVLVMALDYISGTAAACRAGEWASPIAREGLWHKGGMILVVAAAAIADGLFSVIWVQLPLGVSFSWPGLLLPLVLAWYIITELGSILENAVKMGANVPTWLVKLLKIGLKAVNDAGKSAAGETDKSANKKSSRK